MKKLLISLQVFNGLTAVAGGLALMSGTIKMAGWTNYTAFPDLYFPGVILFAVVGGSALIAALAMMKRVTGAEIASLTAGMIMLFWIVGEIVSIREFHWLQVIYLLTSIAILAISPGAINAKEGRK
jgi:hypothetical protein